MPVTDLLAHISAPSSKKADDRYRAMAFAYSAFIPHTTKSIAEDAVRSEDAAHADERIVPATFLEQPDVETFTRLPSFDIPLSPPPKTPDAQPTPRKPTQDDEIAVSKSDDGPTLHLSPPRAGHQVRDEVEYIQDTPTAVLALESQLFTSSLRALGAQDEDGFEEMQGEEENISQGTQQSESTHALACSTINRTGNIATHEATPKNNDQMNSNTLKRPYSPPNPAKADADTNRAKPHEHHPKRLQLLPSSPTSTSPPTESPPPPPPIPKTTTLHIRSSLEIHPPPPTPTLSPTPPKPLTPLLTTLLQTPTLSTRYTPMRQTRPLRPLERGYWLIPAAAVEEWDNGLRREFWECLQENVGGGGCGWGVWCFWDEGDGGEGGRGGADVGGSGQEGEGVAAIGGVDGDAVMADTKRTESQAGSIRIYTFGDAAPSIYLLLFVASKSKIRRAAGVVWVDGAGETVVIVS